MDPWLRGTAATISALGAKFLASSGPSPSIAFVSWLRTAVRRFDPTILSKGCASHARALALPHSCGPGDFCPKQSVAKQVSSPQNDVRSPYSLSKLFTFKNKEAGVLRDRYPLPTDVLPQDAASGLEMTSNNKSGMWW
ncbi:uncharacterized protein K460DRAFT_367855 [Cucurbitaria berberidis CBS 394.84]|uniref:Uncharacterized protein n=1 Tax=Cucurbitaria berberidis CBS 394.84 TaxID=1168544 RepID=A0A9P4L622_9PLEO|nr:uncharacterized protein K460DRAFT_367855 [Cucurbitaria berberidis CBS 394.84]KAF1842917.1 hypothetical protein K460DRAFT_367855 [Cucurbitaria berberidis CBS 394.84]